MQNDSTPSLRFYESGRRGDLDLGPDWLCGGIVY
jgi:hypothetical protein